jgi:hypothetical protein
MREKVEIEEMVGVLMVEQGQSFTFCLHGNLLIY